MMGTLLLSQETKTGALARAKEPQRTAPSAFPARSRHPLAFSSVAHTPRQHHRKRISPYQANHHHDFADSRQRRRWLLGHRNSLAKRHFWREREAPVRSKPPPQDKATTLWRRRGHGPTWPWSGRTFHRAEKGLGKGVEKGLGTCLLLQVGRSCCRSLSSVLRPLLSYRRVSPAPPPPRQTTPEMRSPPPSSLHRSSHCL